MTKPTEETKLLPSFCDECAGKLAKHHEHKLCAVWVEQHWKLYVRDAKAALQAAASVRMKGEG